MIYFDDVWSLILVSVVAVPLWVLMEIVLRQLRKHKKIGPSLPGQVRWGVGLFVVLVMLPLYVFSGGGWKADGSYHLPAPEPTPTIDYRPAPIPDMRREGENIQEESVEQLNNFPNGE